MTVRGRIVVSWSSLASWYVSRERGVVHPPVRDLNKRAPGRNVFSSARNNFRTLVSWRGHDFLSLFSSFLSIDLATTGFLRGRVSHRCSRINFIYRNPGSSDIPRSGASIPPRVVETEDYRFESRRSCDLIVLRFLRYVTCCPRLTRTPRC